MDRFFKGNAPRPNKPISMRGFANALARLAGAVSNARVIGGHIEWNEWDEPTLIIDPAGISDVNREPNNSSAYTDGEERWGRIIYDTSVDPPLLGQYKETWNAGTSAWDESASYTTVHTPTSHNVAHGVAD